MSSINHKNNTKSSAVILITVIIFVIMMFFFFLVATRTESKNKKRSHLENSQTPENFEDNKQGNLSNSNKEIDFQKTENFEYTGQVEEQVEETTKKQIEALPIKLNPLDIIKAGILDGKPFRDTSPLVEGFTQLQSQQKTISSFSQFPQRLGSNLTVFFPEVAPENIVMTVHTAVQSKEKDSYTFLTPQIIKIILNDITLGEKVLSMWNEDVHFVIPKNLFTQTRNKMTFKIDGSEIAIDAITSKKFEDFQGQKLKLLYDTKDFKSKLFKQKAINPIFRVQRNSISSLSLFKNKLRGKNDQLPDLLLSRYVVDPFSGTIPPHNDQACFTGTINRWSQWILAGGQNYILPTFRNPLGTIYPVSKKLTPFGKAHVLINEIVSSAVYPVSAICNTEGKRKYAVLGTHSEDNIISVVAAGPYWFNKQSKITLKTILPWKGKTHIRILEPDLNEIDKVKWFKETQEEADFTEGYMEKTLDFKDCLLVQFSQKPFDNFEETILKELNRIKYLDLQLKKFKLLFQKPEIKANSRRCREIKILNSLCEDKNKENELAGLEEVKSPYRFDVQFSKELSNYSGFDNIEFLYAKTPMGLSTQYKSKVRIYIEVFRPGNPKNPPINFGVACGNRSGKVLLVPGKTRFLSFESTCHEVLMNPVTFFISPKQLLRSKDTNFFIKQVRYEILK